MKQQELKNKELKRKLDRLTNMRNVLLNEHLGNELKFTYWGGYNRGYMEGRIRELEDRIDDNNLNCDKYDNKKEN